MKYLLDLKALKPGDIVLESGETPFFSEAIKKATKSDYSHAMIYTDQTLIHAVKKEGVFSKNPQRILVSSEEGFKVLRLKDASLRSKLNRVCDNARTKVGSLYSITEASMSVLPNNLERTSRKQFCSRLVAQSYSQAGISLVDDANYCTPEDLNNSPLLEVVNNCVREATEKDLEMVSRADPNIENQAETFKWLNLSRKHLKKEGAEIQTINDVSEHLSKNNSSDKRICKFINSTRYLKLYNIDRSLNPYRYSNQEFIEKLQSALNHGEILANEIELNRTELERHEKSLKIARYNYHNVKLKFTKLHIQLYRRLLLETECRLKVIKKYPLIDDQSLKIVGHYLLRVSRLIR
ncbi:YiiX/YebB-like N1pC/P60 family cysteine hydrolase [Aurantivibrio plasticivorans]